MVTDGQVLSADGTPIAFQARGQGEAVVLVPGALQGRTPFRPYAERLAGHLTVLIYDRRGRGASGDTSPYAVEREVEDLEAVISVAGGHASVYGHSSGAALVLHAAAGGLPIRKTVLHDPAFGSGTEEEQRAERAEAEQVAAMLAAGRRADVVRLFFEGAGLPPEIAEAASQDPEPGRQRADAPLRPVRHHERAEQGRTDTSRTGRPGAHPLSGAGRRGESRVDDRGQQDGGRRSAGGQAPDPRRAGARRSAGGAGACPHRVPHCLIGGQNVMPSRRNRSQYPETYGAMSVIWARPRAGTSMPRPTYEMARSWKSADAATRPSRSNVLNVVVVPSTATPTSFAMAPPVMSLQRVWYPLLTGSDGEQPFHGRSRSVGGCDGQEWRSTTTLRILAVIDGIPTSRSRTDPSP